MYRCYIESLNWIFFYVYINILNLIFNNVFNIVLGLNGVVFLKYVFEIKYLFFIKRIFLWYDNYVKLDLNIIKLIKGRRFDVKW